MNTSFKPLSEQVSKKMIADIKAGTSVFQQPNNSLNSAMPFNIESGHRYAGPSALTLLMQKRDDPRWGTSNQANRNHTAVNKGATGTWIGFMSKYEFRKVVDEKGEPVLKENGKQRTERVKLDKPKNVEASMFNGEQMRKLTKWEKEPMDLSPIDRAQLILDHAGVKMENGGDDMFYEPQTDTIIIPDKEQFASQEQYYAEALHQLAHRSYELEGLNRDGDLSVGEKVGEELRTNLASLFISKELNLPYDLNEHVGYLNSWSVMMKQDPAELFKAASDAQKIVDVVLGLEQEIDVKQDLDVDSEQNLAEGQDLGVADAVGADVGADVPKFNPERLTKGEIIPHNGTEFKVLAELKNNVYNMQDLSDKRKFKMASDSGLFASLIEARNNSQEISTGMAADRAADHAVHDAVDHSADRSDEFDRADEMDNANDYQMQR